MCSFFCLIKVKFGSSDNNFMTMVYKIVYQVLGIQCFWSAFYKCNIIYTE